MPLRVFVTMQRYIYVLAVDTSGVYVDEVAPLISLYDVPLSVDFCHLYESVPPSPTEAVTDNAVAVPPAE